MCRIEVDRISPTLNGIAAERARWTTRRPDHRGGGEPCAGEETAAPTQVADTRIAHCFLVVRAKKP
jgi:hypothetical protein